MVKELWNSFPSLLEGKINALLERAEPTSVKCFQLFKTCQSEDLWSGTFDNFSAQVKKFFSVSVRERRKSDLDRFLDRPLPADLFSQFFLTFHNAEIHDQEIHSIVSWSHHVLRLGVRAQSVIVSQEVLFKTIYYVTHPPLFEKGIHIQFEDFCEAWKKVVFKLFGNQHDAEFARIMNEIRWLQTQVKKEESALVEKNFLRGDYFTQTELDWTRAVLKATQEQSSIPRFPLIRGPGKQSLKDLERTVSLFRIVQNTKLPDLLMHRENIRNTVIDQCLNLLKLAK